MATQKPVRILYQAKANTTGLADVKAQVYLNGSPKAVGVSAIALSEVDATNSPGLYELLISGATLTGWGVAAGSYNCLEGYIDSASHSAKAPFREELTVANTDDIDAKLGSPAGASVSADIAAVKTDTAAMKVDLESGTYSLQNILTAVQAIQNNAGFAVPLPSELQIPSAGSNAYRIPVTVYNEVNHLIDPDTNTITVGLVNQAGTSRASYLASTTMTRDSLGQYHVDLSIAAGVPEEELLFTFSYSVGGVATARRAVTETLNQASASGFALQSTLLTTQTTVNDIDSVVNDATFGNAAIKTAVDGVQTDLTALQSDITSNVEGAGFSNSTDSLHAISAFLTANIFVGGRAV